MVIFQKKLLNVCLQRKLHTAARYFSYKTENREKISIAGKEFLTDHMTNVTPKIISFIGRNLHLQKFHPLYHLRMRIINFIYSQYLSPGGNPLFSIYDQIPSIVTPEQNFDSLLVAKDHVSREKKDNYYINKDYLLRSHTTAHQTELIKMGFDRFLIIGDVYRRDEIDSSHYPVFHQADAVRLFSKQDIFRNVQNISNLSLFDNKSETEKKQGVHSDVVVETLTNDLLGCLISLANSVFGKDLEWRWVSAYFPFTHPSWELEVKFDDKWVEMLGCGIIRQNILDNSGVHDKVGWAFGLGLERWAMKLYKIPDIRIFWSTDPQFLSQFNFEDYSNKVIFKPFSKHPPCINDISFWLPKDRNFASEDFYDLVRSVGGDLVEKVQLTDKFIHPKNKLTSHCYRITYRSMDKVFTQEEVNEMHSSVGIAAVETFGITLR